MRIDQILPNFSYGDAIGNDTLARRDTLRRWGFTSDVFAQYVHERMAPESRFYDDYRKLDAPGNVLIYHFSIGSSMTAFLATLSCRKVIQYHNVTPAEFFRGVNRRAAWECERGRRELAGMAGRTDLALGDSEYNRRELEELGFSPTGVLPIFVDFDAYRAAPDREVLRRFASGGPLILHVSRMVPNKRIEDLVKTFSFIRKVRPDARLVLVGTEVNMENYGAAVRRLADELGVTPGIVFAGHVTFPQLLAYYRSASVYLSMSEHEGFCVPMVECMAMGVPVVAHDAGAVAETIGDAGILFGAKDHPVVAELVLMLIEDKSAAATLVEAGRRRLDRFGVPDRENAFRRHLQTLGVHVPT
jgi:glycosyltransferase involved in cell wall biosynthesis